jgi:flagellar motor switch protein FliM
MTQLPAGNLESDMIKLITSRLRPTRPGPDTSLVAVDYDWRQCHHYGPPAMAQLKEAVTKTAGVIADKLTGAFHVRPDITVDSLEQCFARELGTDSVRLLPLNRAKGKACGFLSISSATAMKWASLLLGDDHAKQEETRSLSELEETLLLDLSLSIGQSFAQALGATGAAPIAAGTQFASGQNLQLEAFADVCKMTFGVKTAAGVSPMDIALLCEILDPLVGTSAKEASASPERVKSAILESIKPSAVTIDTMFGHAAMRIKDMVELKPGDVVVLDKTIGESVEVSINGRALCLGQLAAYEGRYAIVAHETFTMAATR